MAGEDEQCCKAMFWVYLLICIALVVFAGNVSGLTIGLMSISLVDLEVLIKAGQPQDRRNAAKILPVVKNQHLLLCTLIIVRPIFLDAIVPAWVAILISITLILAFGGVFSHYGLKIGAKMVFLVRVLLLVFFPISYPISKAGKGGELTLDETTIITGALDLTQKTAENAMTHISETFSLDINSKLDMYVSPKFRYLAVPFVLVFILLIMPLLRHTMSLIVTKGHSRVPIYSVCPENVIGLILVKNLITYRAEDEIPIRYVTIRKIPRVSGYMPLYDILNEFQKGHSHMAVVVKHKGDVSQPVLGELLNIDIDKSSVHPGATTVQSPLSKRNVEQHGDMHPHFKKWERGVHDNVLDIDPDSLPSYPPDEEVIGIITMEDVMEALLQYHQN
ncbi:CBS domain-containing protein [Cinnamomum micranthum f. kanehirae]|uniref:CBS domain-containing protein n=1 Tax=Cinnamomum micranthum f. kanehirae TaxID=337451 RepID=A0A3S3MQB7_9MAGN|nr:CBS domain-containing protein [Cinnamomum micranthum f. kanehirae]